ncbi:cistern family PEP-CTERM protein [Novosphingobium sp. BW1]|uniref:cistern family PEP-CTERM protein n=1 Tax=Novosphingobium sp. BW1 TaxID=2592621 RepID=UPI0011DE684A|nr:cistern family PEP-CTERM protein [Novosphingobium sp. BW1]TYC86879.1 PEP-CTERM sorting domain-containing protein [Novosphingobium sp. BW1]
MNKSICGLAALVTGLAVQPALADEITLSDADVGSEYTLMYDGFSDGSTIDGLTAKIRLTLTGISGNDYMFAYNVSNTTSAPVTGSRISGFAFNTDPTISAASSTGAFSYTTLNSTYPNGIGTVDVCFKDASTGSCAGGGGGGIELGGSGDGALTLSFASPTETLSLSDFYVRYQSITGVSGVTSASGAGTVSSTSGGSDIPEPGMLALFGVALIGLAINRRRAVVARGSLRPTYAIA